MMVNMVELVKTLTFTGLIMVYLKRITIRFLYVQSLIPVIEN